MNNARPKKADNHDIATSNQQHLIVTLYGYISLKIDFIGAKSKMDNLFVSDIATLAQCFWLIFKAV